MERYVFVLILMAVASVEIASSSRIMLVPGPIFSQVNFFSTAGKALKNNGHEVYVLTLPKHEPIVIKYGLIPLIHTVPPEDVTAMNKLEFIALQVSKGDASISDTFGVLLPLMTRMCQSIHRNVGLINIMNDLKLNLSVSDGFFLYSCLYTIPYRLGVKYITLTSMNDPWAYGVTGLPSVEPFQLLSTTNQMNFFQRIMNLVPFIIQAVNPVSLLYSSDLMNEFVPHRPYKSISELIAGSEITLVNQEVLCIGYPRISAPNYQFIGGSNGKPPSPLAPDLKKFVSSAENGIIIASLGSLGAQHQSIRHNVVGALGRLPQKAILQSDLDIAHEMPNNVMLVKSLPQNDLLGQNNTKVFITHGSHNSQLDAVYHGVPMLTIPLNPEQFSHANEAQTRGYGLHLDRLDFTEQELYSTLMELIDNPLYSKKVKHCSRIIKSMPTSGKKLVYWVNHILQFGGDHLRSPASDMPLFQLLLLDIFTFIFIAIILFSLWIYFICNRLQKCCTSEQPLSNTKTKWD